MIDVLAAFRGRGEVTPIGPERVAVALRHVIRQAEERPCTVRAVWDPGPGVVNEVLWTDILASGHRVQVLQTRPWGTPWPDGLEVRLYPRRLPRMIALGSGAAILQAQPGEQGFLLATGSELVDFVRRVHGVLWDQAAAPADAVHLDDVESQVLDQLRRGAKDETAAREINVSVRTYRRHVANLMQRLDVRSRFEAGVRVAQLGLVGHRPAT